MILAVDPSLGGLLLVGEKGTAKSTAARALAEILPPHSPGAGPPPFRDLPLGVTEDRLLGGLDWEDTLKTGRPVLKPGLLGEAHGGLVYIDEVNLLEISLAHLLLDVASAGRVNLEREGLSASYPARVALLATMNPEEGSLGPQLADRFALSVTLTGELDPAQRAEVVRRRLAFEANPRGFRRRYAAETAALTRAVQAARELLPEIEFSDQARELVARLAVVDRLAGHRGDLALAKAARARAARLGLKLVSPREVLDIAGLILASRRRPAPAQVAARVKLERVEKADGQPPKLFEPVYVADGPEIPPDYKGGGEEGPEEEPILQIFKSGESFHSVTPQTRREIGPRGRSGRRGSRETTKAIGRSYRTTARRLGRPLSLSATLRAAAPFQPARKAEAGADRPLVLTPADFREKVYRQKTGRLVIFVVDSSGSIGTLYRMEEAKAAALALLSEAYQKRDRVALIAFYGLKAELLLPPTNSPDLAARLLSELPSGGKTPLSAALTMTHKLLRVEQAKDQALNPYIILMTDGRPNIPLAKDANPWKESLTLAGLLAEDPKLRFLLIDTDRGAYNDYKLTRDLAEKLRAPRINLEELREGRLAAWLNHS
ncbi:MAG: VWA domain-containing protein [Candidatus Adiutrix sp.]|nr:VWA domain-containing protein [Candidatus Adiutrix sp.]